MPLPPKHDSLRHAMPEETESRGRRGVILYVGSCERRGRGYSHTATPLADGIAILCFVAFVVTAFSISPNHGTAGPLPLLPVALY